MLIMTLCETTRRRATVQRACEARNARDREGNQLPCPAQGSARTRSFAFGSGRVSGRRSERQNSPNGGGRSVFQRAGAHWPSRAAVPSLPARATTLDDLPTTTTNTFTYPLPFPVSPLAAFALPPTCPRPHAAQLADSRFPRLARSPFARPLPPSDPPPFPSFPPLSLPPSSQPTKNVVQGRRQRQGSWSLQGASFSLSLSSELVWACRSGCGKAALRHWLVEPPSSPLRSSPVPVSFPSSSS